jgi:hypothetical protein
MSWARAAVSILFLSLAAAAFGATTPVIVSISPLSVIAGSDSFPFTVNGANFAVGAAILVNGTSLETTRVSDSKLTTTMPAVVVFDPGTLQITTTNPGATPSSAVTFTVHPNDPQITSLDPNSVPVGNSPVTVKVNGQNFGSGSNVRVNNVLHATSFVNDTQLTFALSASEISNVGTLQVVVQNINQKFSKSSPLMVVFGATPTITLLSPNSVKAGSSAFTLTVVGTNYVVNSLIKVGGISHGTVFVDSTHLTTTISSLEVSNAGSLSVTITNPNSAVSNSSTLTVTPTSTPTITSISPQSVTQGAQPFTLTITGTNFATGAKANVGNATPRNATFVDATHLTVGIVTADVLNQGQVPISVTTPPPNGGTSNTVNLNVVSQFAPVVTSMTPTTVAAGSAGFKLVITGSGFKLDDIVQFNGASIPTEFISATQIAGTVAASQVATPGTATITVTRKDGSGTSAPLTLTITASDAPSISSLTPPSANVGGAAFTLVVSGVNFTTSSVVTVDNAPRNTTFVSPTELHVPFTASDLANVHEFQIAVVNPGNVISPTVLFEVSIPVPTISTLTPNKVISGEPSFLLKVTGDNFSAASVINIQGQPHATQLQNSTGALTTTVTDAEIAAPGTLSVTVTDNGATSAPKTITVLRPTITGIDPSGTLIGSLSVTVRVDGTAFLSTSKIVFKGVDQLTTFNTDGALTVVLNGADLVAPGDFAINVRNSPVSLSAPVIFTITSPGTPVVSIVDQVVIGASAIIVHGSNFVPLSVVQINGTDRITTYLGADKLSATLLATDATAIGSFVVKVRNPDGTVSNELTVPVTGPPVILPRRHGTKH